MQISSINSKGQVTIPENIRIAFALTSGKKVKFGFEDSVITITPVEEDVSAVFGLLKAKKTVSLEQMEVAITQLDCDD